MGLASGIYFYRLATGLLRPEGPRVLVQRPDVPSGRSVCGVTVNGFGLATGTSSARWGSHVKRFIYRAP